MRKASSDYRFWIVDDKFVGVSLGYDFTAEHEWGIKELRSRFGMKEGSLKNMGVNNRKITRNIDNMIFMEETYKKEKCAILFTGYKYRTKEEAEKQVPRDLENYKKDIQWDRDYYQKNPSSYREPKDPMITAWDESSFGIGVVGKKEVGYLKELYEAFNNLNIVIASVNLMPNNPFSHSSLSLLIADRLPKEALDQMYNADLEYYSLKEYEEKIGMIKIKEKAKKNYKYQGLHYYCACSARWIDYDNAENREEMKKKLNTKYDISYWVNYSDDDNNYGHYTVENIKTWLTGTKKLTEVCPKVEKK